MKSLTATTLTAVYAAVMLMASCTLVDFDNPLDPKGDQYLYGDRRCEAEKITDSEDGAGLFTNPELTTREDGCETYEY